MASDAALPFDVLMNYLDLLHYCEEFDLPGIISVLEELPLEYKPVNTKFSDLQWGASRDVEV